MNMPDMWVHPRIALIPRGSAWVGSSRFHSSSRFGTKVLFSLPGDGAVCGTAPLPNDSHTPKYICVVIRIAVFEGTRHDFMHTCRNFDGCHIWIWYEGPNIAWRFYSTRQIHLADCAVRRRSPRPAMTVLSLFPLPGAPTSCSHLTLCSTDIPHSSMPCSSEARWLPL